MARYGASWLGRPIVVVLLLITVGVIVSTLIQQLRGRAQPEAEAAAGAG